MVDPLRSASIREKRLAVVVSFAKPPHVGFNVVELLMSASNNLGTLIFGFVLPYGYGRSM